MKSLLLALTALLSGPVSFATAANEVMVAPLSGDAVNSTASGNVTFVYNEESESIMFTLDIANPDGLAIFGNTKSAASGANLYCESSATNGGLLVTLPGVDQADTGAEIGRVGKITNDDVQADQCVLDVAGLWTFLKSANVYMIVHSDENPTGELRAEFGSAASEDSDAVTQVALSGDKQTPPVDSTASGVVTYAYSAFADAMVYAMSIANPNAVGIFGAKGAGMYCTTGGTNGGLLVPLVDATADKMTAIGKTGTITADSIEDGQCLATIANLWQVMTGVQMDWINVNVHSDENPSGEIRANFYEGSAPTPSTASPTSAPEMSSTGAPTAAPAEGNTTAPTSAPSGSVSTVAGALHSLPAVLVVATALFF